MWTNLCPRWKMLITLELHGIFGSNFVHYCILYCPTAGMRNGDEASPSIIFAGLALLQNAHKS